LYTINAGKLFEIGHARNIFLCMISKRRLYVPFLSSIFALEENLYGNSDLTTGRLPRQQKMA